MKKKKKSSITKRLVVEGRVYHKGDLELNDKSKKIIDKIDKGFGVLYKDGDYVTLTDEPSKKEKKEQTVFSVWKEMNKKHSDKLAREEEEIDKLRKNIDKNYDPKREAKISAKDIYEEDIERWELEQATKETLTKEQQSKMTKDELKSRRVWMLPKPAPPGSKQKIHKLYQKFRAVFNDLSWNNEVPSIMLFHVIIGCLLRESRFMKGALAIDLRFHFLWVQSTGSGKTSARILVEKICHSLNIMYEDVSTFTDAALIGTSNSIAVKGGPSSYVPEYGFMKDTELMYMDDAHDFIAQENVGKHNLKTRKHFRDAMNPIGNNAVGSRLRHNVKIKFYPYGTYVATTYWFPGWIAAKDRSGFFQRFMIFVRILSAEDRKENMLEEKKRSMRNHGALAQVEKKRKELYRELIKEFQTIDISPKIYTFEPEAMDYIFDVSEEATDYISDLGRIKEFATEFLDRTRNYIYLMSTHVASLEDRIEVNKKDVEYAVRIIIPLFRENISWFEGVRKEKRTEEETVIKVAQKHFMSAFDELSAKNKKILKTDLFEKVSINAKKSMHTIRYNWYPLVLSSFEEMKLQKGRKRHVYIKRRR